MRIGCVTDYSRYTGLYNKQDTQRKSKVTGIKECKSVDKYGNNNYNKNNSSNNK